MGLIKHRPEINLLVEREMQIGGTYKATVVIDAKREVPIEWLHVHLDGIEQATVGSGDSQHTERRHFLALKAVLSEERTIPVGRTELPVRFTIPDSAPASYRGQWARVDYTVRVHVSIDWWPDARESFEVLVSAPWTPAPEDKPLLFSSDPDGPKVREAHVEGSLASSVYWPGAVVDGAIALSNVQWNDYRALEVGLVAVESLTVPSRRPTTHDLARYTVQNEIERAQEGHPIPFRFRLPGDILRTTRSSLWRLDYFFEVRAKIRWGADMQLRVPVLVVGPSAEGTTPARPFQAPPSVGSERIERLWRQVAHQLGFDFDGRALTRRAGESELSIWRDHEGSDGLFLVGELRFPSLHLDIEVEPRRSSLLRHLQRGLPFVNDAWDREHLVAGRDATQVEALGAVLAEPLSRFGEAQLNDDRATVKIRDSGQISEELQDFCEDVITLAQAIERARSSLPPPEAMSSAIDSWRWLARELSAPLETARMSVRGELDGMEAEVITEWSRSGEALQTRLAVAPAVPISSQYHVHLTSGPDGALDLESWSIPTGAVRELATELLADARVFELTSEKIRLALPAPISDPKPLISRLRGLARLSLLLRPGAGPFR